MFEGHPKTEDFELFLKGTSRSSHQATNAYVLRHLLSRCAVCREHLDAMGWSRERVARLLQPAAEVSQDIAPAATGSYDYSGAFGAVEKAVSAFLAPERISTEMPVQKILAGLEALEESAQIERVRSGGIYAAPPVIRALVERSHSLRYRNADEMLHLAHLARLAVEGCSASTAGNELKLADLRARAWGQYGNALRICGQPRAAEAALAASLEHWRQGTGDPALHAWLLEKTSSLAIFQGRFEEAIEMCEEAGQIYQELGNDHSLAFTLTQKAIAILYSGEAAWAVRTLNQAMPLIDAEDPHLLIAACHNLIRCYIDLDRPDQALALYAETRELYKELDDPLILLRMAWQEGLLLRDLGHLRAAETALLKARKGYMEEKLAYEVALVSLDLTTVYVKLGLVEEVKRTVMTTVPIFHALRVKLETLAALLQIQKVADQEQQALELIRTLHSLVEPLRHPVIDAN
jgi:tetratricopeptide (TPR) repeat protein